MLEEESNRQRALKHLPEMLANSFVMGNGKTVLWFGFFRPLLLFVVVHGADMSAVNYPFCEPGSDCRALQFVACHKVVFHKGCVYS